MYVVYEIASTRIAGSNRAYKTEAAAKSALTRLLKFKKNRYWQYTPGELAIAELKFYYENIEMMVERVNLMSGEKYLESVNTPSYCSPASESYWSM